MAWNNYRSLPCFLTIGTNDATVMYYEPNEYDKTDFSVVSVGVTITKQLASAAFSFAKGLLWDNNIKQDTNNTQDYDKMTL